MDAQPSRRQFLSAAAGVTALPARPNLVVILSDQQHWRALGCEDRFFDTPNLDALAHEACVFESAFCATPQCSPSRSSLLTGWYPSRTGVMGNVGALGGEPLRMKTVGGTLREGGYYTGYFGKWHLGGDPIANDGWNEESKDRDADPEVTPKAVRFIERAREPFALFVSYLDPHRIYDFAEGAVAEKKGARLPRSWRLETFANKPAPQKDFMIRDQGRAIQGRDAETWQAYREYYRSRVARYDGEFGRCMEALRRRGASGSTVVIATSDHGDMDTEHRLIFKGPFMYEHLVRIPLIVRTPGTRARRITDFHSVNTDIPPTLLDFAGLRVPECHGQSLRPLLEGRRARHPRPYVIGQYYGKQRWVNPIRMIRTSEFKYNRYIQHGEELYDLRNDPDELVNLAGDAGYARRKSELAHELKQWMAANEDPFDSLKATPW